MLQNVSFRSYQPFRKFTSVLTQLRWWLSERIIYLGPIRTLFVMCTYYLFIYLQRTCPNEYTHITDINISQMVDIQFAVIWTFLLFNLRSVAADWWCRQYIYTRVFLVAHKYPLFNGYVSWKWRYNGSKYDITFYRGRRQDSLSLNG